MDENVDHCLNMLAENDISVRENALRVLLKICDNIIKYPEMSKYRRIQVANATISEKLLPASGGVECLFELGFVEDGESFLLPSNASLSRVQDIEKLLRKLLNKKPVVAEVKPVVQSTAGQIKQPQSMFLQTVSDAFHRVLDYEKKELQEKTRRLIPINRLQLSALKSLRTMQKKIKFEGHTADEFIFEDVLLAELLSWFKNEFFTWFNSPICKSCSSPCSLDRIEYPQHLKIRIEIHKCKKCSREEKFPRYIDPETLLITRKGRCGEWANVFTLICRSLGYDARIVFDRTDHVWTEVWSISAKRWIHADPCENSMDCPLLYERGWKKKLTYIMAFSKDEVQDVTWRYTRDQAAVMKRRNLCSEKDLLELIRNLNEERQSSPEYSSVRKQFVKKRYVKELADFLPAPPGSKKPSDEDEDSNKYGGRISGDVAWRLLRGEISAINSQYIWRIPRDIRIFQLKYFIVKDLYEIRDENDKILEIKNNWNEGIDISDGGIIRKVESDWKMVYLARSPGNTTGKVTWSIEMSDDTPEIDSFELRTSVTTFETAEVEWSIQSENRDNSNTLMIVSDCKYFETTELKQARKISVTAKLSGGNGDIAWQHAQLFRQSINAVEECSLMIIVRTKDPTK